jgi:voltage-gated potassium channel
MTGVDSGPMGETMAARDQERTAGVRRRVYEILELGRVGDTASRMVDRFLVTLIIVNLVTITLESMPSYAVAYQRPFLVVEVVSSVVFTIEYVLRVWSAVEDAPLRGLPPLRARLKYVVTGPAIVDLLAVVPFWLAFMLPEEFRALLVLRMVRFLKLTRYSAGMRSLLDAVYDERRALFACLVILIGATLLAAAAMHLVERDVQPDKFGSIPTAMWWAIVTLATVGYGDVVPITPLGRLVGGATILVGMIIVALPVGIIATAFAREIHRRDFVITWGMVARVPLFAGLNASEIAEIMRLLRTRTVEAGAVISYRGDEAHSMYFIAAGEVEIQLANERLRFGEGHFFGEVAVLRRSRRSATITALTRTSLLILDANDLRTLMDRQPQVAERIHEVVRSRVGSEVVSPKGDIVLEEIIEPEPAEDAPNDGGKK